MNRRHLLLSATLFGFCAARARASEQFPLRRPDRPTAVPEIKYLDEAGNETDLAALKGRVVVLNLWATWCAPCRTEMPSLDLLQTSYPKEQVTVLAVSVDRAAPEKVKAFMDDLGISHVTVGRDPTLKAARILGAPGLPTTLLIDRAGMEVGRIYGIAAWEGPEAAAAIDDLLKS